MRLRDERLYEEALFKAIPTSRPIKYLDLFFFETFRNLPPKTRSIIEFNFSTFLYRLLREPIYSLFCNKNQKISVRPEDSLEGKIILLNLPVKKYHKAGRDCQTLFKYIWQVEMEKRNVLLNGRPVFLWADESQNFTHEHDAIFQATARSSRVATVYITQNLPNYYASMGGDKFEERVKSLLGTMGTKIFHANADIETNKYASELIGDGIYYEPTRSVTMGEKPSENDGLSLKVDKRVRPEECVGLLTGGVRNIFQVECYIHVQGDKLFDNRSYRKVNFNQKYK